MEQVKLVAPTGVMGIGFSYTSFQQALDEDPDFIGCDAGSTDWGPYHLGAGTSWSGYEQTRRDLEIMLLGARRKGIPLLIGSAGFSGSEPGLTWTRGIAEDIAGQHALDFRLGLVHTELTKEQVIDRLRLGRIKALDGAPELTEETIERSARIVGMIGTEPFQAALDAGADVVLAGRSSDTSIYAAIPTARGIPPGVAWHLAKIVECGNAVSEPVSAGACIVGTATRDGFTVKPAKEGVRCTVNRVAAHMLYENATPFYMREPSGTLDTSRAVYTQQDDVTVRVTGSAFQPADRYTVRLEGVEKVGYRSMCLVGVRDPSVVSQIDEFTRRVADLVHKAAPRRFGLNPGEYTFGFRRYGYDAVLGPNEPNRLGGPGTGRPYEIGLVIEATAPEQHLAHQLISGSLPYVMHGVQLAGTKHSANGALAYAPSVVDLGAAYRWSVWHALELEDPLELFRVETIDVKRSALVAGGAR